MPRNIIKKEEIEIPETENNLELLVNEYFEANTKKKDAEKITKTNGEKIKKILLDLGKTEYKGKHTATVRSDESVGYDDEKLLELVCNLPEEIKNQIIKTVQVVDMNALERAIIENKVDIKDLKDAEVRKVSVKLFVK